MDPTDLRYHQEHEWIRIEGAHATLGISQFAQEALGDIVFLEMPKLNATVKAGQEIGEVESTKTTSTIYTPVSGKIVQINTELKDHPELVNQEPYDRGWIAVIELSDPAEADRLMTASQYGSFLATQKK